MRDANLMIEEFAALIPAEMKALSGAVFFSGRTAFSRQPRESRSPYVLGLNPGGNDVHHKYPTVEEHTVEVLSRDAGDWSEYRDVSWGRPAGESFHQRRVRYMLNTLGFDERRVPASNLIFVRSVGQVDIEAKFDDLAERCWTFHANVLETLAPHLVICFGQRGGRFVCDRLNATQPSGAFTEANRRGWTSRAFRNKNGIYVVVASHPSRANWITKSADPTAMIAKLLR
jgi:hypothetical protein